MQRRWLKVLTMVALATGAAAACDRPTSPLAPRASGPVSPRLSVTSGGYFIGGWKLLEGSHDALQTRINVIDQRGGKLNIGASALIVPAGAVSGPTMFVFTLQTDPYISTKLVAMALSGPGMGRLVTVFAQPLTLTISYAGAKQQVPDPAKARVLWVENGVLLAVQPTSAQGNKLTTTVTHFTEYVPSIPDPNDDTGLN